MSPNTGAPRFRPYASTRHHVTKGRYITSNDSRGYIPVYEYPLNGQWIMMDIDDGYILWTGIWKALGNSKADIVKMIDSQPDLAQVIRRVRGGYLKIQGTWMPYEVALRLSRRVAWPIREDLIPLFGPTFPSTCLSPDQPGYGQIVNNHGRRRSRRPATAPAPSPAPPLILQDPRDNPIHPSWGPGSSSAPARATVLDSSHDAQQATLHQYHHRGSISQYDRSPPRSAVDLVAPSPLRDRGAPPSASLRYSPYLSQSAYAQNQGKLDRRTLSRLSIGTEGSAGEEVNASAHSPVPVEIPSLTLHESSSRPLLHLQVPSHSHRQVSQTENIPLSAPGRIGNSLLSRTKSFEHSDKFSLPPIRSPRAPLSASAVSGGIPSLFSNTERNPAPYALPPISALEDLRGVNAQDSAAVLRRLTADDETTTHDLPSASRPVPIGLLQPPQRLSRRQNSSPSELISDYDSGHYQPYPSDSEHCQVRHDVPMSPSGTSSVSPSTPSSVHRDTHRSSSSHAILVREASDIPHVNRSPRHRISGIRNSKDGIEDETATGDIEMDFVGDEKARRVRSSPVSPVPMNEDERVKPILDTGRKTVSGAAPSRVPHRPW